MMAIIGIIFNNAKVYTKHFKKNFLKLYPRRRIVIMSVFQMRETTQRNEAPISDQAICSNTKHSAGLY